MNRTRLALAASTATVAVLLTPQPAHAVEPGGQITHWAPDNGFDPPIDVGCYGGGGRLVYEGQRSNCPYGTSSIYIWSGQELWCRYAAYGEVIWYKEFDATGSHATSEMTSTVCVMQAD